MKFSSFLAIILLTVTGSFVPAANAQAGEISGSRKVVSKIMPAYPEMARKLNLNGAVKLVVVVAPNGSVKSIHVLGGNPLLALSAQEAVRGWKWEKNDHETSEPVVVEFNP
jgi:TonB family protein